jgi:hypothetical protein
MYKVGRDRLWRSVLRATVPAQRYQAVHVCAFLALGFEKDRSINHGANFGNIGPSPPHKSLARRAINQQKWRGSPFVLA